MPARRCALILSASSEPIDEPAATKGCQFFENVIAPAIGVCAAAGALSTLVGGTDAGGVRSARYFVSLAMRSAAAAFARLSRNSRRLPPSIPRASPDDIFSPRDIFSQLASSCLVSTGALPTPSAPKPLSISAPPAASTAPPATSLPAVPAYGAARASNPPVRAAPAVSATVPAVRPA